MMDVAWTLDRAGSPAGAYGAYLAAAAGAVCGLRQWTAVADLTVGPFHIRLAPSKEDEKNAAKNGKNRKA